MPRAEIVFSTGSPRNGTQVQVAAGRHGRPVGHDPAVREERRPEAGAERDPDDAGMVARCARPGLAQHERLGVVQEDALSAGPDRGDELAADVDVVERLELREPAHLADAALVVERARRGDADQLAASGDRAGGAGDRAEQLCAARVGPERDPRDLS